MVLKYREIWTFLLCLMLSFVFFSCATLKKEECLTVDWYNIGYEDGTRGYESSRVALHRKACSKYGVIPDLSLYQKGRSEGLAEYCTPHKGYLQGLNGRSYHDVCQGDLKEAYQRAYHIGRDIYLFKKQIQNEQRAQDQIVRKIDEIDQLITEKETLLSQACKNSENCTTALNVIRDLDMQKSRLEAEYQSKEIQIKDMKQTLDDMKNQNRF